MTARVLVVDDDPVQRRLIEAMVRRFGHEPVVAEGGDEAIRRITAAGEAPIDCVVLDLVMPDLDGLGVLGKLRSLGIDVPVIVQTAHGGIDTAVTAVRAGAFDFVVKPVGAERLQVSLANALAAQVLKGEVRRMRRSASGMLDVADISSRSTRMQAALRLAAKAAGSSIPVLIEGESGVGKEIVARAIHGSGERRSKPFVTVNCGAIPANLAESILFGHERGAFTGAEARHAGRFFEADGGTLFLDEIGELPMDAQVKLLRVLQEGEVDPVGARRPVKVDVRIISATNRDLVALTRAGGFREDLFYRLHVFPITLPPLRERSEDIPDLVRRFVARFAAEEGKPIRTVSAAAMRLLCSHRWPGNVRQLENVVFRAVVLAEGDRIDVEELPQLAAAAANAPEQGPGVEIPDFDLSIAIRPGGVPRLVQVTADAPATSFTPVAGALAMLAASGHVRSLEDIEAEVIRFAIDHYKGRMTEVARRLGIGRSTLYRKLAELGLDPGMDEPEPPGRVARE
ncbi:sigma-54 dependent transcriptional regulator [Bosea sp. 117]|uniref:sigma-54-dependent transcriptional regulator n=1 Tax=Bosea sp. 117 TaxID=1125973 RepID=UPI000494D6B4|nr:sigma-54 dependent transcriptional regulator [Bosea sp. 117]